MLTHATPAASQYAIQLHMRMPSTSTLSQDPQLDMRGPQTMPMRAVDPSCISVLSAFSMYLQFHQNLLASRPRHPFVTIHSASSVYQWCPCLCISRYHIVQCCVMGCSVMMPAAVQAQAVLQSVLSLVKMPTHAPCVLLGTHPSRA